MARDNYVNLIHPPSSCSALDPDLRRDDVREAKGAKQ